MKYFCVKVLFYECESSSIFVLWYKSIFVLSNSRNIIVYDEDKQPAFIAGIKFKF